jgi:hypothetical protein
VDGERLLEETMRAIVMVGGIAVGLRYAARSERKGRHSGVVEFGDDIAAATFAAATYAYSESLFIDGMPDGAGDRMAGVWIAIMVLRWASRVIARAAAKEIRGPFG